MQIGKERSERKAIDRVYPDRNRIRLSVNGASEGSAASSDMILSNVGDTINIRLPD